MRVSSPFQVPGYEVLDQDSVLQSKLIVAREGPVDILCSLVTNEMIVLRKVQQLTYKRESSLYPDGIKFQPERQR